MLNNIYSSTLPISTFPPGNSRLHLLRVFNFLNTYPDSIILLQNIPPQHYSHQDPTRKPLCLTLSPIPSTNFLRLSLKSPPKKIIRKRQQTYHNTPSYNSSHPAPHSPSPQPQSPSDKTHQPPSSSSHRTRYAPDSVSALQHSA
jgi:hypothetical protein